MPETIRYIEGFPKRFPTKRVLSLQNSTLATLQRRAVETSMQPLKNWAINRTTDPDRKPKREMSETETKRSIAEIMYNHIHRLERNQDELITELNIKLNELDLLKESFLRGSNFIEARGLNIAAEAHKIQVRKLAGKPYLVHPLRVALLSIELAQAMGEPITSELVLGALMHDTIEDSPRFGENGEGGAAFKKETIKSLFGTWSFSGLKAEAIAADADAFDHNTAIENGEVNDAKYYEKLKHWRRKVFVRRQIIKTADRIDNLLDPLILPEGLYTPRKGHKDTTKENLQQIKFLDGIDHIINPYSRLRGQDNPPEGSQAENFREKRINYIEETSRDDGIIKLLLPEGSFLRRIIYRTIDIAQQTVCDPYFTRDGLLQQLKDEATNNSV